eukprot:123732_1
MITRTHRIVCSPNSYPTCSTLSIHKNGRTFQRESLLYTSSTCASVCEPIKWQKHHIMYADSDIRSLSKLDFCDKCILKLELGRAPNNNEIVIRYRLKTAEIQ